MERETGDGEEKGRGQEEKGRGRVKGGRTGGGGERRMGKGRNTFVSLGLSSFSVSLRC